MIYFIKNETGDIKIGYTVNVEQRIVNLQTAHSNKLELIKKISGSRNFERKIHDKFNHLKINGEWFRSDIQLLSFINELAINEQPEEIHKITLLPSLERQMTNLGRNIKLARLRRGLSATTIAERAGITRKTLHSLETGCSGVSLGVLAKVLLTLGLSKDLENVGLDDVLGRKLQDAGLEIKKRAPKKRIEGT